MIKLGTSSVFFISRWMDGRIAVGLGSGELVFLDDELQLLDRKSLGKKSLRCCLGERGLIGGSDGLIWRLDARGDILKRWEANSPSVFCLAEDSQGDIVSGGRDALLMWMGEDGELKQEVKAHLFTIHALAGSELGWLASGSMDKTVKIWDRNTGELLKVIDREKYPSRGHSHSVNALCWLAPAKPGPNANLETGRRRLLASAGDDKIIRVWEVSVWSIIWTPIEIVEHTHDACSVSRWQMSYFRNRVRGNFTWNYQGKSWKNSSGFLCCNSQPSVCRLKRKWINPLRPMKRKKSHRPKTVQEKKS